MRLVMANLSHMVFNHFKIYDNPRVIIAKLKWIWQKVYNNLHQSALVAIDSLVERCVLLRDFLEYQIDVLLRCNVLEHIECLLHEIGERKVVLVHFERTIFYLCEIQQIEHQIFHHMRAIGHHFDHINFIWYLVVHLHKLVPLILTHLIEDRNHSHLLLLSILIGFPKRIFKIGQQTSVFLWGFWIILISGQMYSPYIGVFLIFYVSADSQC